ncbi:ABC transporter substrate-binding protein [Arhodomonas sp. SL1]|uniref:ABC transporter substrate-binding protein n=1 Tax=Arhodomonas sp. SL1 TaxID=3425691 RepID=UPI003F8847B6
MYKSMRPVARAVIAGACALGLGSAAAAEKPDQIDIGITAFLSGPASVFGEPARAAAEIVAGQINADGGIHGVPVNLSFIDEGAGGEHLLSEYRRLVQSENYDIMFSAISSGNCLKIAPLAEDLEVINLMWDCGTQRVFEEGDYNYVFRTQANATPEMLASVLYLLRTNPDFDSIAVVNQDYAWGRDSWDIFRTALDTLKPGVEVTAEFFPKFGTADFSTEITRLLAMRPDVILSTSWGGDLDNFVRQAEQRGLHERSLLVLPLAESSLERLGEDMPAGVIVGARGDHYYKHPGYVGDAEFDSFVETFRAETGNVPIYSAFHMVQAFAALQGAYNRAIEANDGEWPSTDELAGAFEGLSFRGLTSEVTIRAEDHQGLEDQMLGTTARVEGQSIAELENIMVFPGEVITTPAGQISGEWLQTLSTDFLEMEVTTYPGEQ